MAAGAGASINGIPAGQAFNRMIHDQVIPISATQHPVIYLLFGTRVQGKYETLQAGDGEVLKTPKMSRNSIAPSGTKYELQVLISKPTFGTVADTTAASAANTLQAPVGTNNPEFDLTEGYAALALPYWDQWKVSGDVVKASSYFDVQKEAMINAFQSTVAGWFHATTTNTPGARGTFASIHTIVDSGNTYGFDRTDAGNIDWRSNVVDCNAGPLSWSAVRAARVKTSKYCRAGSSANTIIAGEAIYNDLYAQIENKAILTNTGNTLEFGGEHFSYAGVTPMVDFDCAANYAFLLEPSVWCSALADKGFNMRIVDGSAATTASDILKANYALFAGCKHAARQTKFKNITVA